MSPKWAGLQKNETVGVTSTTTHAIVVEMASRIVLAPLDGFRLKDSPVGGREEGVGEGGSGRLHTVGSVALLMMWCWDKDSGWYCPAYHQRLTFVHAALLLLVRVIIIPEPRENTFCCFSVFARHDSREVNG